MSKGIDIAIAADTRSAMSAISRGLIDPLEDVSELLAQIGTEGDEAGGDIEKSMRDAQRRTDDAKDEIKDLRDELNRTGRAGKKAGDDIDDGMRRAEDGVTDLKDEANSTAREAAASFDGSAESIADAFQEVAANAFAGFGPAGAVAGLAAAAGIGLAAAGFTAADEARQASEERIAEWADAFIEAGSRTLTAGVMAAKALEILTEPEKFKEAESNAKAWGVSVETAIAAMTGNKGAISDVTVALDAQKDAAAAAAAEAQRLAQESGGQLLNLTQQEQAYLDGANALGKLTGEMRSGQQRAQIMNAYYEDLINSTAGVVREVDELGNELYTLPDGTQIMIDAKTGQASQNISNFKGDLDELPEEVTTTVRVVPDTRAWDEARRRIHEQLVAGVDVIVRPGQVIWE